MQNYLLKYLESYFDEILVIEGNLTVSESFMQQTLNAIKERVFYDNDLISSITTYRDLSMLDESKDNLFTPNFSYQVNIDSLENDIMNIVSQQCCFSVSSAYEVFETFLIEIITEYLFFNQHLLKKSKLASGEIILLRETIRTLVKKNDNKSRLSIMRRLSSHFKVHEVKNIHHVNIAEWFDVVTMARHVIIHNRQIISNKFLQYLAKTNNNEMFDRHFKRKRIKNDVCIYLEKLAASEIVHWLNSFVHFIFKSLSLEMNLPLHIPQYIPPPLQFYRD